MSGGVDSSISAWLLSQKGYDVAGFFIKFWSDPTCSFQRENSCCDKESLENARSVASKIGIPFYVLDAKKLFKKIVVDNFIREYKNLKTPNPCINCNKFIKFGWFLDFARMSGFSHIATGHYARVKKDKRGIYCLLTGCDRAKDQSYFLYQLSQEQLSKIIFPIGQMEKKEVINTAKIQGLLPKNKKESQEICFIQDKDYRDFLKRHLPRHCFSAGDIVDEKEKIVGRHFGLVNYTIGQRKGIEQKGVKNENRMPLYVLGFNKRKNELVVGPGDNSYSQGIVVKNVSWLSETAKEKAFKSSKIAVKIRYRNVASTCRIRSNRNKILSVNVVFDNPQRAVTPGQSAVFYLGEELLGGGIIERASKERKK